MLWFAIGGLLSGLASAAVIEYSPGGIGMLAPLTLVPGTLFALALVGATQLAVLSGRVGQSRKRSWVGAVPLIILAWPIMTYSVSITMHVFGEIAVWPTSGILGLLTAVAMRVLTGQWVWRAVVLLALTGPAIFGTAVLHDWILPLAVSQLFLGAACGYWLIRGSGPRPQTTAA